MTKRDVLHVRAGDTSPLTITVSADGLDDLSAFQEGYLYAREAFEDENHVDGAAVGVLDSDARQISFDPVGAGPSGADAFDFGDEGNYDVYVRLIFNDGSESRFPGEEETLIVVVTRAFETL